MKTLRALLPLLALAAVPALAQTITTGALPNGILNQQYSAQVSCSSCQGYSIGLVQGSGAFPPGLGISSTSTAGTATINGIPSAVGTYAFSLALFLPGTNVVAGEKGFSINIPSGLTILTTTFPNGTLGAAYAQTISASGGVGPPYTWQITAGALPPGLGIANNNSIVGTPTSTGTYNFTLSVSDSKQNGAFTQTSITIGNGTVGPAITTSSLPNGIVNVAYNSQLTCSNCAGWTWSLSSGNLPLGLTINAGGAISGTPTEAGTASFQITLSPPSTLQAPSQIQSISQIYTITITASGLVITQTTIPIGFAGTPYSTTLAATGGLTPYTWSLTSTGNDGLTIGASTGILSGTPTANGTFILTVQVNDSSGLTATRQFTLSVSTGLSVLTTTLPNGSVGTVYPTQTLSAGGGQPPYRWTIPTGKLPPGLTLDGVFGRISGTPTANGNYPFTLTVTDNQSNTATGNLSITIGAGVTITISPATLTAGTVGTAYSQSLTASGGTAPYTYTVVAQSTGIGILPPGLTLNASTGAVTGTPTTAGTFVFTIQATDSTQASGQQAISLTIAPGAALSITTATLANGTVGTAYSATLAATGGTSPYTWSLSTGTLPAGLSLNAASGAITGTPTAAATASFTVQVADSATPKNTATKPLGIVVAAGGNITIAPATLPAATIGTAYTQALTATGGASPYKFAVTAGSLPAGFSLSTAGSITGTAAAAETGTFTVTATDSNGATGTIQYTLAATAATVTITIAPATLPAATAGTAYTQALTASGGASPYKFAVTTGSLPAGFSLSTAGSLTGTATAAETGTFTVTATDSNGVTGAAPYTLTVNAAAVTITIAPATLPAATVGTAYSQALTASGGASPYKFAVTTGSLPAGLTLSTAGSITGTATAAATATFTVTATDANNATGTHQYTLAVNAATAPTVTLSGVPATSGFQQQLAATPTLSGAFPSAITGTVTLIFTPSVTAPSGSTGTIDDNMIQFSGGAGRTATFNIAAGSTTAGNLTVLTGTTAGTITLTTTLSSGGAQLGSPTTQTIVNAPGVPFISKVTLTQVAGGVSVVVTGFSSTRDMVNASFQFAPATGDTFTSNNVSVPVQNAFNTWWANTGQSNPVGTEFTLTVPFTLATATQSVSSVAVVSVTVTLQNSKGASNPVSLSQ